ncbi:MAG: hypothetical protein B0A82_19190 [Alkalinema sp. CACIAM 70d]|nr:MAG: hypothetical protein B0A82_19190 [Alkalinema sp. CACIAM 70d]
MMLKLLAGMMGLTPVLLSAQATLASPILPGRCHMGTCWDSQFISKTVVDKTDRGTLYRVQIAHRSWPMESDPSDNFGEPQTNYVLCSTQKPAYIFESDGTVYAHLLNPGGDWFGYNQGDYPVYWATCHNFVGPNFFSDEMTEKARSLGYPLDLPSDQIELTKVTDILE